MLRMHMASMLGRRRGWVNSSYPPQERRLTVGYMIGWWAYRSSTCSTLGQRPSDLNPPSSSLLDMRSGLYHLLWGSVFELAKVLDKALRKLSVLLAIVSTARP